MKKIITELLTLGSNTLDVLFYSMVCGIGLTMGVMATIFLFGVI